MGRPIGILLSEVAYQRYWPLVVAVAPEARAVRIQADRSRVGDLEGVEVAWATDDINWDGLVRPFYGAVVHTPTIRWFQSPGAGFDDPFFARLVDQGATLTASHVNASPIAEHVVWAALDRTMGGPGLRAAAEAHEWRQGPRGEVRGQRWTIVGFGSIARAITPIAQALGVVVRGVRRSPAPDDPADEMFPTARLHEALADAEVVVLATPLDATTAGMADAGFFAAMEPGSLLINVGRGGLVVEPDLMAALDAGRPGAAVLDVAATEPLPADDPLWSHPAVTITPHIAGSGEGNSERLAELFVANLGRYLRGERMVHQVDPADLGR